MSFFSHFPYSDTHTLNLDWLIAKVKEIAKNQASVEEIRESVEHAEQAASQAEAAAATATEVTQGVRTDLNAHLLDYNNPHRVTADKIGALKDEPGSVKSGNIAQDAVTASKIATEAVSTEKIRSGAVTLQKIANQGADNAGKVLGVSNSGDIELRVGGGGGGAVNSVNGQTGEVLLTAPDVGAIADLDNAVKTNNIEGGAVTLQKIANQGAENSGKVVGVGADGSAQLIDVTPEGGTVVSVNGKGGIVVLNAGDVGAIEDAPGAVDNELLSTGAVTLDKIANQGTENVGKILRVSESGDVELSETESGAVESVNGQTGAVVLNAADVGALSTKPGAVGWNNIADRAIGVVKLATSSEQYVALLYGQYGYARASKITGEYVSDNAIPYVKLSNGSEADAGKVLGVKPESPYDIGLVKFGWKKIYTSTKTTFNTSTTGTIKAIFDRQAADIESDFYMARVTVQSSTPFTKPLVFSLLGFGDEAQREYLSMVRVPAGTFYYRGGFSGMIRLDGNSEYYDYELWIQSLDGNAISGPGSDASVTLELYKYTVI